MSAAQRSPVNEREIAVAKVKLAGCAILLIALGVVKAFSLAGVQP
jgi:hypothetical protein